MADHGARAHAEWAASSTNRNWNCPGALALVPQVEHLEKESEAAAWGTACHQISERCLRSGQDAIEYVDRTEKTKEHSFIVDEEMAETAQEYIDYVRRRAGIVTLPVSHKQRAPNAWYIEQKFSLEKLNPPFESGGTADAVVYFPAEKLLEVIDLKGGRGVKVEVTENKQLRTYALGALLANPGLDVTRVKSTIVQPRISHVDGRIRSEEYHVIDLMEWTADLLACMGRAKEAKDAYAAITGERSREAWAEKFLNAGDHCTFCPAAGFCPALEKKAFDAAGFFFDEITEEPRLKNTPDDLSPERLAAVLDAADLITGYLNACRSLAHGLAESGVEIPNYQLVEKVGRRKWKEEDEAKLAETLFLTADLTAAEIYTPKIKTPAQMEKVLKKNKGLIAGLIETPVTGKNLVRSDLTTRPAVAPAAHQFFDVIES